MLKQIIGFFHPKSTDNESSQTLPESKKPDIAESASNIDGSVNLTLDNHIQLTVMGIPQDVENIYRNKIIKRLMLDAIKNAPSISFPEGSVIYQKSAKLNWSNQSYTINYTLRAIRFIETMKIYKISIDNIQEGVELGIYDHGLAETAARHITKITYEELDNIVRPNNGNDSIPEDKVDKSIENNRLNSKKLEVNKQNK